MPHIPTKDEMIKAVKTSGCPRLNQMPVDYMTQAQLYTHLLEAKCPCLRKLMAKHHASPPHKGTGAGSSSSAS